ncbi:hypothetical protein SAMN05216226_12011 [Halovenus aranensis]|uniref:Uncharacterized protein n=1 Tax=Halovenus aranensis TaxID=890420 RepID=A0A1G8ZCY5_9EURY|nr:hypothetical protein SAMN05216226_12011 [Halovenus aranensis]
MEGRFQRLYPGRSAVLSRLQHSCFTDGAGVLQSDRDYQNNHDQPDIYLKCRFPVLEVLKDQIRRL